MDWFTFPRVQAIPGPDSASFVIDGRDRACYRFATGGPRPFVWPLAGPTSGRGLTRIGHPNPVGHEHHWSIWFGHQFVNGMNFWEEKAEVRHRLVHRRVRLYHDGMDFAGLVAEIDWEAAGAVVMKQALTLALVPLDEKRFALDLQSRFEAPGANPVELGKTNFGFLGVRVAKTMSERFGGGRLTNSEGATGEPELFGKIARWVDYSGLTGPGTVEGIAYLDHPTNPRHPNAWHVRADGWMACSPCLTEGYLIPPGHPLDLRYRLVAHDGPAEPAAIDHEWERFAATKAYETTIDPATRLPGLSRL